MITTNRSSLLQQPSWHLSLHSSLPNCQGMLSINQNYQGMVRTHIYGLLPNIPRTAHLLQICFFLLPEKKLPPFFPFENGPLMGETNFTFDTDPKSSILFFDTLSMRFSLVPNQLTRRKWTEKRSETICLNIDQHRQQQFRDSIVCDLNLGYRHL